MRRKLRDPITMANPMKLLMFKNTTGEKNQQGTRLFSNIFKCLNKSSEIILPNLKHIVPIVPTKNRKRASISMQIDIKARIIRDPKSAAAPNETIMAASIY